MSYLDRIRDCNHHNPDNFRPFVVDGKQVGRVRHEFADTLTNHGSVFHAGPDAVVLDPDLETCEARSEAIAGPLRRLSEKGVIADWRDEAYPVVRKISDAPLMQIDRAAAPYFGIRAFGVHLNGYVRKRDGLHLWIGRRSRSRRAYPGMLDNMVAGGQPVGISLVDNLVKECAEEASLPEMLARQAVSVGAISYCLEVPEGLKPDVMYCFDLELPEDFEPVNADGELEEFYLWPVERVAETVRTTTEFKFNCNLVIIDFLIRHGVIPPDHPDYLDLLRGLRS